MSGSLIAGTFWTVMVRFVIVHSTTSIKLEMLLPDIRNRIPVCCALCIQWGLTIKCRHEWVLCLVLSEYHKPLSFELCRFDLLSISHTVIGT